MSEQVTMGVTVGITDDLASVTVEMQKNGVPLGYIVLDRVSAEGFAKNVIKYASLLKETKKENIQ